MTWFKRMWQFRKHDDNPNAALAAKIKSEIELENAKDQYRRIDAQTDELHKINQRNHFSEALRVAFGGEKL